MWPMIPAAGQGQVNFAPSTIISARTAKAPTSMAASDSHHDATGRHSAPTMAPAWERAITKPSPGSTPPLSPSWAASPSSTPSAARQTTPCGNQRSHTDGGSGSARQVHRSSWSTVSRRPIRPVPRGRLPFVSPGPP